MATRYRPPKSRFSRPAVQPLDERAVPPALGPLLKTKCMTDILPTTLAARVEIEDSDLVASYNLLEGLGKVVLVPGRPPAWTPLPPHSQIKPDNGEYYRDENAARFPRHPMEPAVRSVFHMTPSFETRAIDVFACGSTLGDILRFSLGKGQPFSFVAHVVGQTAFWVRRNVSPTEVIGNVTGFGHSYPEANTTWAPDVVGSHSHQRIIKYTLGGLQFLVRFEGDGYTLDGTDDLEEEGERDVPGEGSDDVIDRAASWTIGGSETSSNGGGSSQGPAVIRSGGALVSQSSVFDIKTRSSWKSRDDIMAEQLPRLWIRQIHKIVLALHTRGDFDLAEVQDITNALRDWEQDSADSLMKMARVMRDICDTAMEAKGKKIEVRGIDASTLEFREVSGQEQQQWKALPDDLERRWK